MEFRRLGRSGLSLSVLSYGNWLTHGSQVEEDAALACVAAAHDVGITTFDTADVYAQTRAESVLGRALAGHRRESYELCTKVFWPTGPGPNDRGLSRKHIVESCHASLRRLQTDYVDLYQAHRFDPTVPLEETLRAFDDLIRAGKVLYVGVSEWTAAQIREAVALASQLGLDRLVSNQPQYSLLWRVIERDVVPTSAELGLGQLVWSPLAQGVLTGKYAPGAALPAGSRATDPTGSGFLRSLLTPPVLQAVADAKHLVEEAGLTLPQFALAWVLRNPNVTSAIIGASRPDQVHANAAAVGVTLDDDLVAAVEAVLAPVATVDADRTG